MKSRIALIDALKFVNIALVILGHVLALHRFSGLGDPVFFALVALNMPLFACLSGYVLFGREPGRPGEFLRKKSLALMVPYFAWAVVGLLLTRTSPRLWLPTMGAALVDPYGMNRLWYLYVLFTFYVLFVVVRALSRHDVALVVAAALAALLFLLPGPDLLGRGNVQRLFPFFVAGYLYAKHGPRLGRSAFAWLAPISGLVFVGLVALNFNGPNQTPAWYTMPLRQALLTRPLPITYFLGAASMYVLPIAAVVFAIAACALLPKRLLALLAIPGSATLGIYAVQQPLLRLAFGTGYAAMVASWALILAVSWLLVSAIQRVPVARQLLLGYTRSLGRTKQPPGATAPSEMDEAAENEKELSVG